jgi:ferredoxin-like protein FixX
MPYAISEALMSLFIEVEVTPAAAKDAAIVKKLVEVCPVNIFAAATNGGIEIVDTHLDECTLCELCLQAAPPGTVRVKKLYGEKGVLERHP